MPPSIAQPGSSAAASVAVAIPCLNEEAAIGGVVAEFRAALPAAEIYVYDNASTDRTPEAAQGAGAVVRCEPRRGKGNVVRRIFRDFDADILVLVDGDGTYPADHAPRLIDALVAGRLDMVSGARGAVSRGAFPRGHRLGNAWVTGLVGLAFGRRFTDVLSGYRALSRRFVKSFPIHADSFQVEAEMAVHALEMRLPVAEVEVPYSERAGGSSSKLRTVRDGASILTAICMSIAHRRPLALFLTGFAVTEAAAAALAWPLLSGGTGAGPASGLLAGGLALLGLAGLGCGLVADGVARARREAKCLRYLALPGPPMARSDRTADEALAATSGRTSDASRR